MEAKLNNRIEKARVKALPLIKKYDEMDLDQRLIFIRNNRDEFKQDHNIINRYYNLEARDLGFAKGMSQVKQEGFK